MERETFYAVAAQVIPVLLLVLLVEARLQPVMRASYTKWKIAQVVVPYAGIMVIIIAGEIVALTNLWRGKEHGSFNFLPLFVIVMELVLVVTLGLVAMLEPVLHKLGKRKPPSYRSSFHDSRKR